MSTPIRFMAYRRATLAASAILVFTSVVLIFRPGLNLGEEFRGGALIELTTTAPMSAETVTAALATANIAATAQHIDSEQSFMLRIPAPEEGQTGTLVDQVMQGLSQAGITATLDSADVIGPTVGKELSESAGLAAIAAFIVIGIYIVARFSGSYAIGAVVALIHDVTLTLGMFAAFQWTFDLPAFAAVLAIVGYSLNDTIVVFDRIRDHRRRTRNQDVEMMINRALTETWERTLIMSGTTLVTTVALLIFGGSPVRSFAIAMTFGVVVGTYSSIYIASDLLLRLGLPTAEQAQPLEAP